MEGAGEKSRMSEGGQTETVEALQFDVALTRMGGDRARLIHLMDRFIEDCQSKLEQTQEVLEGASRDDALAIIHGLKETADIPVIFVTAIADVFDALTTVRPYKSAWEVGEALEYIQQQSGSHFDPDLVRIFLQQTDKVDEIRLTWQDETES